MKSLLIIMLLVLTSCASVDVIDYSKEKKVLEVQHIKKNGKLPPQKIMGEQTLYIRQKLVKLGPKMKWCYEKRQLNVEKVSGSVDVSFTINSKGRVRKAKASSKQDFKPIMLKCVKGVISMERFKKPYGGGSVEVKQPFNFHPEISK